MKLTRIELCCLRVADGIATPKDFERLKKEGIDPENWRSISSLVRKYLLSNTTVDFADELMQIIQTPSVALPDLRRFLIDPEKNPSITDQIMEKIFEDASTFPLPLDMLKEVLKDPEPPSLTDMIMASVLRSVLNPEENSGESEETKEFQEFQEIEKNKEIGEIEEFASEDLLDAVFSDNDFPETLGEVKDEPFRELLRDDDSIEFFPELSEAVRGEWTTGHDEIIAKESGEQNTSNDQNETDDSFDALLQEELAKILQEALSEEARLFDEAETVSNDLSLIEMTEEKAFTPTLERIEVTEQEDAGFEDDSDEEILTLASPYVITEAVLEEQSIRCSWKLNSILVDDEADLELDIWSSISSKIIVPPLRLVRDSVEASQSLDDSISPDSLEESTVEESNQAVEFISTKTIDVDSTISKVSFWTLMGLMVAAATWLILILPNESVENYQDDRVVEAFEVAEINTLEVEELEVAENMEVQIFQAGEDAPTIIFIDSYVDGEK